MMSRSQKQRKRPSVDDLRNRLAQNKDVFPYVEGMSLRYNGGSMKMCIMQDAWKHADREPDDPGEALQVYFPEQDLLLVDLS